MRYLSGFTGSNAALLIRADDDTPVLATDGRYRTQAAQQVSRRRDRHRTRLRAASGGPGGGRRCATARLRESRRDRRRLRLAADEGGRRRRAGPRGGHGRGAAGGQGRRRGRAAAAGVRGRRRGAAPTWSTAGGLRPGRTEKEVGRELESLMLDHGADGVSFETIVAAGANSAIPHHRPTDAVLAAGDFVKIDFGALVARIPLRHDPHVRAGARRAVAARRLRPGRRRAAGRPGGAGARRRRCRDVDAASRQVIADAGYAENFGHGLGHGVGLQIHEAPGISASAAGTLLAGSAVTVEPGVYLPGRGGVRIEDTLVVGEKSARTRVAHPVPQGTGHSVVERLGVVPPWHRPPTSRTGSSCRSTASCGRSPSSSTSSRARAPRSCAPSSRTCCPARSSTRRTTRA